SFDESRRELVRVSAVRHSAGTLARHTTPKREPVLHGVAPGCVLVTRGRIHCPTALLPQEILCHRSNKPFPDPENSVAASTTRSEEVGGQQPCRNDGWRTTTCSIRVPMVVGKRRDSSRSHRKGLPASSKWRCSSRRRMACASA